ncbi:MAG: DUF2071 domain-containing protein [Litorilinea sp.]
MFRDLILQQTAHRPWPMSTQPWRMVQSWHDLLFAHWPVPLAMLRPHIPPALEIDTYDDTAWLSIVPFHMRGVRPRFVPGVPWLSAFAELNVRTYVHLPAPQLNTQPSLARTQQTKPGVFFFSLDAANPVAVEIARSVFHLPYFNARMSTREINGNIHYHSLRTDARSQPGEFRAVYRPTGGIQPAMPGTLDHWLAERYALYTTDPQGRLYCGEIHHLPWPLQPAEAEIEVNTLAASVGLESGGLESGGLVLPPVAPILQFSRRLDVIIWPLRRIAAPAPAGTPVP